MSFNLFDPIIRLSEADLWKDAAMEWKLLTIEWRDEGGHCICNHYIKEHCQIENMINGNQAIVGNCCINKFPQFSGKVYDLASAFRALKNKKVNAALIEFARDEGILNDWEYIFLLGTWRKRKFTSKQAQVFNRIKRKIRSACMIKN